LYYLSPRDEYQEGLLPPAVWAVLLRPLHWQAEEGLTPRQLANKLLVAVFRVLDADLHAIGYYLALNRAGARARQLSRSQPIDYGAWWAWWRAQHWASPPPSALDRQRIMEWAAMALFCNPPVCWHKGVDATASSSSSSTPPPKDLLHNACMVVCQKAKQCSYMKLVAGYPTMVLGKTLSGAQVTVKVAHLVAWLFHGPKDNPAKFVVPQIIRLQHQQQPGAYVNQPHQHHRMLACTVCCHVDVGHSF
jgi:hypothetical protein